MGALLNPNQVSYASQINNNERSATNPVVQPGQVGAGGGGGGGRGRPGPNSGITLGTGSVRTILSNTFEGNLAGAGDGGGIALVGVNGTNDVGGARQQAVVRNRVDILNNVIVDKRRRRRGRRHLAAGCDQRQHRQQHGGVSTTAMPPRHAFQGGPTLTDAANCANGTNTIGVPAHRANR